jgi:2-polyprenyl-6-methoxyphenol hydroxylase-like FAD-dependent oxidoreductase
MDSSTETVNDVRSLKDCAVLIVGAGPSGLAAACELQRQGITDFLIVEKLTERNTQTKGTGYNSRTLELLEPYGTSVESLLNYGSKQPNLRVRCDDGEIGVIETNIEDCKYEYILSLEQHFTEKTLAEYLNEKKVTV